MTANTAPIDDRINEILARARGGAPLSPQERATLANLYAQVLVAGEPTCPLAHLPREFAALLIDLLALPRGATLLSVQMAAPRALFMLSDHLKLSVIAEAGRDTAALRALLSGSAVSEGPLTRYMVAETFDYACAGLGPQTLLAAPGYHYDHASIDGRIPADVAAVELAVSAVKAGGFIGLIGTRQAFHVCGGSTLRWWLRGRTREIGTVFLPLVDAHSERLQLALFEKRVCAAPNEPLRIVLPHWCALGFVATWREQLARQDIDPGGFAASRSWSAGPIALAAIAATGAI